MKLSDQIALRLLAWRIKDVALPATGQGHVDQDVADRLAEMVWPTCKALGLGVVKAAKLEEDDVCPDF
jgi:hypothetical protein